MRMKTIFLSMLTIAALASCTRQDFIDPNGGGTDPGGTGDEMVVELTISSTPLTKATGQASESDKKIDDITVFGVNTTSKAVISRQFFSATTESPLEEVSPDGGGVMKASFKTTDQTDAIYVIANVGTDLTGVGEVLNLTNIGALNNAKASLLFPGNVERGDGKVLMSGYTNTIEGKIGTELPATASVSLNFIASKVILKSITRAEGAKGEYGTNFELVGAMLSNVNTAAYYFADSYPFNTGEFTYSSFIKAITTPGVAREAMPMQLVSGAKAPAEAGEKVEKVTAFYEDLSSTPALDNTHSLNDVAYWYVFENSNDPNATKSKQTAFQLEYKHKTGDGHTIETHKYISVIFGNNGYPKLEPGKTYAVNIQFDADLSENATPPGGDDPDVSVVEGQIGVTVTPAEWTPGTDVDKPVK